jgi:hypothetical protein
MTSIDMIVLHPSRNISHAFEVFVLFESSVFVLVAVVVLSLLLLLSFVDEYCLNQTIERSSSLRRKKSIY